MTIDEFKILHKKFSKLPLSLDVWQSEEYNNYIQASHENQDFQDWILIQKFEQNRFDYYKFCCLKMSDNIFESIDENGEIKYGNVDVIINKLKDGTYGIPIHDGGSSIIEINFCPWCGTNLKKQNNAK
ncbi:MAG: hypothetical protein R2785_09230 [Flavobacteriaceae bacterium]